MKHLKAGNLIVVKKFNCLANNLRGNKTYIHIETDLHIIITQFIITNTFSTNFDKCFMSNYLSFNLYFTYSILSEMFKIINILNEFGLAHVMNMHNS